MTSDLESDDQEPTPEPSFPPEQYLQWRAPRLGRANPERLDNPVWDWLIRARLSAYDANKRFAGPSSMEVGPAWCFARVGQSTTNLPDGRVVYIAGEHEDHYDPDFYIYNDVVVREPNGQLSIFDYPREVFPPTDFHTATLAGDRIVIIGNLSYLSDRRPGCTPVFVLDLRTFSIQRIETSAQSPGWLHSHSATFMEDGSSILVQGGLLDRGGEDLSLIENLDDWKLCLNTWRWEKLTERNWPRWSVSRGDNGFLNLFEIEQAEWRARYPEFDSGPPGKRDYTEADFDLHSRLYRPGVPHELQPDREDEFKVHRITVEGITIRYVEDFNCIRLLVEGELPQTMLDTLTSDLVEKLSTLERATVRLARL